MPDEADNHFIELAMAGRAAAIITHKVRDIRRGELLLNGLQVHTPGKYLEKTR
jgi:predicted nucleic acid-binding protein